MSGFWSQQWEKLLTLSLWPMLFLQEYCPWHSLLCKMGSTRKPWRLAFHGWLDKRSQSMSPVDTQVTMAHSSELLSVDPQVWRVLFSNLLWTLSGNFCPSLPPAACHCLPKECSLPSTPWHSLPSSCTWKWARQPVRIPETLGSPPVLWWASWDSSPLLHSWTSIL